MVRKGTPSRTFRTLVRDSRAGTHSEVASMLRAVSDGAPDPVVFATWEDTLGAARTGAYDIAVLDVAPAPNEQAVRTAIKAVRRAAPEMQIIAIRRSPEEELEGELRMLGVVDLLQGADLTGAVLKRSLRLARERARIARELRQVSRLRECSRMADSVLDEIGHAVLGINDEGEVTYANPAAAQRFAQLPDHLLGTPLMALVDVGHRSRVVHALERSRQGCRTSGLECRLGTRKGAGSWMSLDIAPWRRGAEHAPGSLIVATDISNRQTLRPADSPDDEELKAALASVLDTLPVGILIADERGRPRVVNRVARDLLGMNALLPVDRWASTEIFYTADGGVARDRDLPVLQTLQDGLPRREVEMQVGRPGTRPTPVLMNTSATRDENGCVVEVSCAFVNISDQKRLEEQLRQAQKISEISGLVGGVAHDFNNMLCAIMGYAELLEQIGLEDDRATRLAMEIRKAGDRAAMLTRQLLTFSRREQRNARVISINDAVTDMESLLRRLINEDIRLLTEMSGEAGNVRADPGRLGQVLLNLVVNARDAMPTGGDLYVSTEAVELRARALDDDPTVKAGPYVLLKVRDTGVGMTEDVLTRIFEPYFTTKARAHGTGLGLSTVYGIVKECGGHIRVESELGVGTEFLVYLPQVPVEAEAESPQVLEPACSAGDQELVLLVEDEPMVRALIREILELSDYEVIEAADGRQALDLCKTHGAQIRAMVTDVVMPEMSGRELAERVLTRHPDVAVLFVSGYTSDALLHYGVCPKDVDFLQKPFMPGELTHRLSDLLESPAA